jgi:hypothetical protein
MGIVIKMKILNIKIPQKNKQIFLSPSGDKISSLLEVYKNNTFSLPGNALTR